MKALSILFYSIITLIVIAFGVNRFVEENTLQGEGPSETKMVAVDGFDEIDISGAWEVILKPGDSYDLQVEVQENLREKVNVVIQGNRLSVEVKGNINPTGPMRLIISAPVIRKAYFSGASSLKSDRPLTSEEFEVEFSGASKMDLELDVDRLFVSTSGAGHVILSGHARETEIDISGAGKVFASTCEMASLDIEVSGAGEAEVFVTERLAASVSGAGSIRYKGSPTEVVQDISGAGSVNPM